MNISSCRLREIFLCISFLLFLSVKSSAQTTSEEITITTYYPSPYGVYNTLTLYPNDDHTPGGCLNTERGQMYYDNTDNKIYVCDGTNWGGLGGGFWAANGNDIYNINSGNVGIGTTAPGYKLEVIGDVKANNFIKGAVASGTLSPGSCSSWEVDTGLVLDSERFDPQRAYIPVVTTGSFWRFGPSTKFKLTPQLIYRACFQNTCNNYTRIYLTISCDNEEGESDYPSSIYWRVFEIR